MSTPDDDLPDLPRTKRQQIEPETWRAMREHYNRGASPAVIAEHYGVSERTIRYRAASEEWGHNNRPIEPHDLFGRLLRDQRREQEANADALLLTPDVDALARLAFQRATEAAALDAPVAATTWLRLLGHIRRNADLLGDGQRTVEARRRRADYLHRLTDDVVAERLMDAGMSADQVCELEQG